MILFGHITRALKNRVVSSRSRPDLFSYLFDELRHVVDFLDRDHVKSESFSLAIVIAVAKA